MGRNKDLRRNITGLERAIARHESKIRHERAKPNPNESLIAHWQGEIEGLKKQLARFMRRLSREW